MRGRRANSTEIEALDAGLTMAGGEDYVPPDVEKELEPKSAEELLSLSDLGERLEDAVRIRNGWVYMMIRRKVGHGNFKKFLEDNRKLYKRAWDCMCYARAVQRYPGLAGKVTGHAIRHILALPAPEIHKIEEAITGIPAEHAKKITRAWIEKEYRNIQAEKQKPPRKREYPDAKIVPSELAMLVPKAVSALRLISDVTIPESEYEQAKKYLVLILNACDRASYNLRDPEHKTTPLWELDPMADDVTEEDNA